MMLQLINRHEPVLRHYLGVEQVHPEQIYRDLIGLLGELATFSSESKRPRLAGRYQHSDQGASFRKLLDAIRHLLSMVLTARSRTAPAAAPEIVRDSSRAAVCQYGYLSVV